MTQDGIELEQEESLRVEKVVGSTIESCVKEDTKDG